MKQTLALIFTLILFTGCGPRRPLPIVKVKPHPIIKKVKPAVHLPSVPKKELTLKETKDTNYSDTYMYPEDTKAAKKDPIVETAAPQMATGTMTKEACISMISQEKFDKYTAMFGSEDASIKRCAMLQAMNQ